jgi:multidrug resistance efflux pump
LSTGARGRVIEVNAREGDVVRRGDVLMRLDTERVDADLARERLAASAAREDVARLGEQAERLARQRDAARARAEAELAQAEDDVRRDEERREADVKAARRALAEAREAEERTRGLVAKGALPRVDGERALSEVRAAEERLSRAEVAVDRSRLAARRVALEQVERDHEVQLGEVEIRRESRRTDAERSERAIVELGRERAKATLRAHVDGIVTVGDVKVGDIVDGGKPVFAIAQQKGLRVDVLVPNGDAGLLRVGMKARVKLDAFDHRKYGTLSGTVSFISPDSDIPEQPNLPVFYVVRLTLESAELAGGAVARMGMTGTAEVVTDEDRLLVMAVRKLRSKIAIR